MIGVRVRVCERVRVRAWSQIRDERSVDGDGRTDGELGFGGRGLRSARVREGQRATAEGQRATAREQISRVDVPRSVLPQLLRDGRGVRYHESTHAQDRPLAKHIKPLTLLLLTPGLQALGSIQMNSKSFNL